MSREPYHQRLLEDFERFFIRRTDSTVLDHYPRYVDVKNEVQEAYEKLFHKLPQDLQNELQEFEIKTFYALAMAGEAYYRNGFLDAVDLMTTIQQERNRPRSTNEPANGSGDPPET